MTDYEILDVLETADHDHAFCPRCSEPTTIVAGDNGDLFQICTALTHEPRSGVAGILDRIRAGGHLRRLIITADRVD